jgi:hypothetical protein
LIVSQREANRIYSGRKTQHRLPRDRRAPSPESNIPISYRAPNPALGYNRDGTPKEAVLLACRVVILERWESRLYAATEQDAKEEGFKNWADMIEAWGGEDQPVWVVRFRLDTAHRPRLLASRVVAGRQGAYTDNPARALPDEPEAVDPFFQDRITAEARSRDREREQARHADVRSLPFEVQLAVLTREARARHIDIRSELRAIQRWTNPRAREAQLERIRKKLDRTDALRVA